MTMKINPPIATNNYIITGSAVLNIRYSKDIDVICYEKDITVETTGNEYARTAIVDGKRYEFLLADNQESLQYLLKEKDSFTDYEIAYIMKAGHIHIGGKRQDNWEKHMHDYHMLRQILNTNTATQSRVELIGNAVLLHRKTTDERVRQRTPKLNGVKKDEFFDDFVKKHIDHDRIHEEVAYDSKPAYTKMQKDETVECHKDLWDKMSHEEKFQCVAEEASVIAIERHILPFKLDAATNTKPLFLAYKWALYRICTTLCSGWFRRFAINNYYEVLNMYNQEKLENNINNILTVIKDEQK
jgi:hypothetical protein